MTDEQIWAEYGKAAVNLEIATGKFNDCRIQRLKRLLKTSDNDHFWAEYGKAAVNLEIATGKFNDAKKKVVEMMNRKPEPKQEEPKAD